ncbi:3'(2'),5'-bisphosphate nucleotidase CysQ, partial [Mesorhizobium sp. M8A.F.Ca.ET.023.02.2.1]
IRDLGAAEIVSVGSSLKFCLLANGEADVYPRFGRTMEWDTAAGDAVLRAAGGTTRTLDGKPLAYGKRNQADDEDFANPHFIASGSAATGRRIER